MYSQTHWLLPDVVESVWCGVDDLALDLVCPTTVVSQAASGEADVTLGHGQGLSVVERLNGAESVNVGLEEVGQLGKHLATVTWGDLPPGTLESLACSGDSDIDILLGTLVNGADDLLGGRVDGLEGLAVYTLDPFIVDETGDDQHRCVVYIEVDSSGFPVSN